MLCRISTIRHPSSDYRLQTPLLIPSFSSKGFTSPMPNGASDLPSLFASTGEFLTDPYLLSAYDIHHKHLPPPAEFRQSPEVIFVDSGGYEASLNVGYSAVSQPATIPQPWTADDLQTVFREWPQQLPAAFVSYDHPQIRKPLSDQIAAASELFRHHRDHLHVFLLKPETSTQFTLGKAIKSAVATVEDLDRFDIVGVTEKELGRTMLDRMSGIVTLRLAMDEAGLSVPLHVFGALDPLSVCLYYISGAELFDGLSWLRYGYHNGVCVYMHNLGAIEYGLNVVDDDVRMRTIKNNIYVLQELKHELEKFAVTKDLKKLTPHERLVSEAFDSLKTRFKGRV